MNNDWIITESAFDPKEVPKFETLFALGNGFLGIRGSFEENLSVHQPGTFINGFYESEPIVYGEHAYGYAKNRQRMIPITDGTKIQLFLNGEVFDISTGTIHHYRRFLDLRTGILTREVTWESPEGSRISAVFRRLVSSTRRHTAAFQVAVSEITPGCKLSIVSSLNNARIFTTGSIDPRVGSSLQQNPMLLVRKTIDQDLGVMRYKVRNSGLTCMTGMANTIESGGNYTLSVESQAHEVSHHFEFNTEQERPIIFEKFITYHTSIETDSRDLSKAAEKETLEAQKTGFEGLANEKEKYLQSFWAGADVRIESNNNLQESIRFTMFHLLQAAGKWGYGNIPAKGLTGEGYEGHYFWDTEIYLFPFFLYTVPDVAKNLLIYRYKILPAARRRAEELHHKGALFPWRTINGEEASAYFPAGTAQYHINADIAYACRKYWHVSGDDSFMAEYGGEILFETARFWSGFADFIPNKGYCFNCVTGPDEYTALVNNNAYTNYMAKANLAYAVEAAEFLKEKNPRRFRDLKESLQLSDHEISVWKKVESSVYLPYDRELDLIPQDDAFLQKAVWDFASTPKENYPLLLHYHPLTIYRFQVLKQPDLMLALLLLSASFSPEDKIKNFEYYDPLTTGDSSLSSCIQSIIATEVGKITEGEQYFLKTARMDLDDINKNVKDGIHAAAMGGTWLTLIYGFAGLRDDDSMVSFSPRLPPSITALSFRLNIHGNILSVTLSRKEAVYTLLAGEGLTISHCGKKIELQPEKSIIMHINAH